MKAARSKKADIFLSKLEKDKEVEKQYQEFLFGKEKETIITFSSGEKWKVKKGINA